MYNDALQGIQHLKLMELQIFETVEMTEVSFMSTKHRESFWA